MKMFLKSTVVSMLICLGLGYFSGLAFSDFDFADPNDHYLNIADNYHNEMNEFFNEKFEGLLEVIDDENFLKDPELRKRISVPESINEAGDSFDDVLGKCREEDNYSSYCVSMEATERYVVYLQTISANEGTLVLSNLGSAADQFGEIENRRAFFADEKLKAQMAMKRSLAVYNEFSLAYPMHKKYQDIFENLILYRQILKDIRLETDWFPLKFIDSTSPSCK